MGMCGGEMCERYEGMVKGSGVVMRCCGVRVGCGAKGGLVGVLSGIAVGVWLGGGVGGWCCVCGRVRG